MYTQIEQVIAELSKIDNAAENILLQTEKEKEKYDEEIKQKTLKYDKELETVIKNKLSAYESKLKKETQTYMDKLQKDTDSSIKKLEDAYNKNHTKWAKDILNNLLKRQGDL